MVCERVVEDAARVRIVAGALEEEVCTSEDHPPTLLDEGRPPASSRGTPDHRQKAPIRPGARGATNASPSPSRRSLRRRSGSRPRSVEEPALELVTFPSDLELLFITIVSAGAAGREGDGGCAVGGRKKICFVRLKSNWLLWANAGDLRDCLADASRALEYFRVEK